MSASLCFCFGVAIPAGSALVYHPSYFSTNKYTSRSSSDCGLRIRASASYAYACAGPLLPGGLDRPLLPLLLSLCVHTRRRRRRRVRKSSSLAGNVHWLY